MQALSPGIESALAHLGLALNMEVFSLELKQGTTPVPQMVWDMLPVKWRRLIYTRHTMLRILGAAIKYMYAYFTPVLDVETDQGPLFRTEHMWEYVVTFYDGQNYGLSSFKENGELNVPLFQTAMEKISQHVVTTMNNASGYEPTMEKGHPSARDRTLMSADAFFIYHLYLSNKLKVLCENPKPADDVLFERLFALELTTLSHMVCLYNKLRYAVETDKDLETLTQSSVRFSTYVLPSEYHNMLGVVRNLLAHIPAVMQNMGDEERDVLKCDMEQEQEYINDLGLSWDTTVYNDDNLLSDAERTELIQQRLMSIPKQMLQNHPDDMERLRKFREREEAINLPSSVVTEETI